MRLPDLFILILCCLFWAGNFVISAWILSDHDVPPFLFAFSRGLLILLFMLPWLFKPLPADFLKLLVICILVSPLHLTFLYWGLQTASASASSLANQVLIPLTTLFSVLLLGEKIGLIRSAGIIGGMIGVGLMIYDPVETVWDIGLVHILIATVSMAFGTVLIKKSLRSAGGIM